MRAARGGGEEGDAVTELRSPYPFFGGKRRIAPLLWKAFGPDVPNYVEAFFGSGATLLARPGGPGKIETVCDLNSDIANFWRAVQIAPDEVARWADRPVFEVDLHAIHRQLVAELPEHRERMKSDPEYFDARRAGLWCFGICCWIGGGWCAERKKPWEQRPDVTPMGVLATPERRPNLYSQGRGILAGQLPSLHGAARGVVNTRLPSLGNARGVHGAEKPPIHEWFAALQDRFRRVRVVCGDFERVLGPSVIGTTKSRNSGMNPCAILLDAPYSYDERDPDLYAEDSADVAKRAARWALENGDDPDLRIAVCGLEGEHEFPSTWSCVAWSQRRGYGGEDNNNRHRERVWLSPHCLPIEAAQTELFAEVAS